MRICFVILAIMGERFGKRHPLYGLSWYLLCLLMPRV